MRIREAQKCQRRIAIGVTTAIVCAAIANGLITGPAFAESAASTGTRRPMGGCGQVQNVKTPGARAHWELNCKDGEIKVSGWVEDTDADGQCAKVKAVFASGVTEFSAAACPKNNRKLFSWAHPGSIADVYLCEYTA